jgi:hypothetical protein
MYNSAALSPFPEKTQPTRKADPDLKLFGNTIEYIVSVKTFMLLSLTTIP